MADLKIPEAIETDKSLSLATRYLAAKLGQGLKFGEHETFDMSQLATDIGVPPDQLRNSFWQLCDSKYANQNLYGGIAWDAKEVEVRLVLDLKFAQTKTQPELEYDKSKEIPAPQLTEAQKRDARSRLEGTETLTHEGYEYRVCVYWAKAEGSSDGSTHVAVRIEDREAVADDWSVREDDPQQFAVLPDAWGYWEQWMRNQGYVWPGEESPTGYTGMYPAIHKVLFEMERPESGELRLTPKCMESLYAEFISWLSEKADPRIWESWEYSYDPDLGLEWMKCWYGLPGTDPDVDALDLTLVSDPEGIDLFPAPPEAAEDEPTTPTQEAFPIELEDGAIVDCRIRDEGRGTFTVSLEGPVNEAGTYQERVTKAKHGGNVEKWAADKAEGLRKGFLESKGNPEEGR